MKTSRHISFVSIVFESDAISVAQVRRSGESVEVVKTARAALPLDPRKNEASLVGQEIQNLLRANGIRERNALISVPLRWGLTLRVPLPDIPEGEVASFISIQAERELPYSPQDMRLSWSVFQQSDGTRGATVAAIPKMHLEALRLAARAAGLKLERVILAPTTVLDHKSLSSAQSAVLVENDNGLDLVIVGGGGVMALRRLDLDAADVERSGQSDTDAIVRQTRITLGQFVRPAAGQGGSEIRLFSSAKRGETLLRALEDGFAPFAIPVQPGQLNHGLGLDGSRHSALAAPGTVMAVCAATSMLSDHLPLFTFSAERDKKRKPLLGKLTSIRLIWAGSAVAALVVLILAAFIHQHWTARSLASQWAAMSPRVKTIETLRDDYNALRLWRNDDVRSLEIARLIAEAFPETGDVYALSMNIRNLTEVSLICRAADNEAYLRMQDRLREFKSISNLNMEQYRQTAAGRAGGLTFSLKFTWTPGGDL